MKKLLFLTALAFQSFSSFGQIPNTSFENWTNNEPDGWWSVDQIGFFDGACISTSDAHSGSFAVRLNPIDVQGVGPVSSMLALSDIQVVENGIPYTQRPTNLSVWVKYNTEGGDTIFVAAQLYKQGTRIGEAGAIFTGTQTTYTQLNYPFTYSSADNPDSMQILFFVGILDELGANSPNSYLIVDDLNLSTGATPPAAPSNLVVAALKTDNNGILLNWQDNSNDEDEFFIERATSVSGPFTQVGTTLTDVATYTDNTTSDGVTYFYRVLAKNSAGNSSPSNVAQATANITGIDKSLERKIFVFPNPATSFIGVEYPAEMQGASIKIFNALGAMIIEQTADDNRFVRIPLNLATGIYRLQISNNLMHSSKTFMIK